MRIHWKKILSSPVTLLVGVIFLVVIANQWWIHANTRPPHWDMGRHLEEGVIYFHYLKQGDIYNFLNRYLYYPPLVYYLTIPYLFLAKDASIPVFIFSNTLFLIILVYSVYGIGKSLWNRQVGVVAGVMVLGAPMLVTQFKEFQLDAPLTAMVALAIYLLIKSEQFKNQRVTFILGVVLGLGSLTKWSFPFILLLPVVFALGESLWQSGKSKDYRALGNLLVALLAGVGIAAFWYLPHDRQIYIDVFRGNKSAAIAEGDPVGFTWKAWRLYAIYFLNFQMQAGYTLLFLGGLMTLFWRKERLWQARYLLLWLVGTYCFFSYVSNKDVRYTLSMTAAAVLIGVSWLAYLKKEQWKKIFSILLVIFAVFSFSVITFGASWLPQKVSTKVGDVEFIFFAQQGYIIGPPARESWNQEQLFRYIVARGGEETLFATNEEVIWFNSWGNAYYSKRFGVMMMDKTAPYSGRYYSTEQQVPSQAPTGYKEIMRWPVQDGATLQLFARY